jgi:hypothetical protein
MPVIAKIKLGIRIPVQTNPFYIKRNSDTNFHMFQVDWDTSLYVGDQLKVPPGSKVSVICQPNGPTVRVPDDGIPWAVTMACPPR